MNNIKIEVVCGGEKKLITAPKGHILSKVLSENGFTVETLCAGNGTCGKCEVLVNGESKRSCKYILNEDITVILNERTNIQSISGAAETEVFSGKGCFVLDIGTTTLALALVSLETKETVKVFTGDNPQKAFGADVITRIEKCRDGELEGLNKVLITAINKLIEKFSKLYDLSGVNTMYVAGNTTMLHLFLKVDCSSIGVAPYTPKFLESMKAESESLGILKKLEIITLPGVSSFVGADIVAGMNLTSLPEEGKYYLLIDLGTNAEVVLYNNKKALCTAAAAGPCFEGANISSGMSGSDGAVNTFDIVEGEKKFTTIGNKEAKGICGTGLIDIIAALRREEIIDDTAFMEEDEYEISGGVTLIGKDIRQFQLAKSAVLSAAETLAEVEGIELQDIDKLYISGGFSSHINVENAVYVGLLPKSLKERCIALNNSSLLGSIKYALNKNDLKVFTENTQYADLSQNPSFTEKFMDNMYFE